MERKSTVVAYFLGLKTDEGEFNILAQLLSDDSYIPLRVSIFDGQTKIIG